MLRRRRIRNWLAYLAQWMSTPLSPDQAVITDEQIRDILRQDPDR